MLFPFIFGYVNLVDNVHAHDQGKNENMKKYPILWQYLQKQFPEKYLRRVAIKWEK